VDVAEPLMTSVLPVPAPVDDSVDAHAARGIGAHGCGNERGEGRDGLRVTVEVDRAKGIGVGARRGVGNLAEGHGRPDRQGIVDAQSRGAVLLCEHERLAGVARVLLRMTSPLDSVPVTLL